MKVKFTKDYHDKRPNAGVWVEYILKGTIVDLPIEPVESETCRCGHKEKNHKTFLSENGAVYCSGAIKQIEGWLPCTCTKFEPAVEKSFTDRIPHTAECICEKCKPTEKRCTHQTAKEGKPCPFKELDCSDCTYWQPLPSRAVPIEHGYLQVLAGTNKYSYINLDEGRAEELLNNILIDINNRLNELEAERKGK